MNSERIKKQIFPLLVILAKAQKGLKAGIQVLLILAALISSLFFQGINIYALLLTQTLLVGVLAYQLVRIYAKKINLRIDLLSATMLIFWFWLAISVLWSQVPYISGLTFWWVGALPLTYLIHVLSPDSDVSWRWLFAALVFVGVLLAMIGICQFAFLNDSPRGPFIYRNLLAAFLNMLILALSANFFMVERDESETLEKDGRFVAVKGFKKARINYFRLLILSVIFLLILTVGMIQSRGALLCLTIGMISLVLLCRPHIHYKRDIYKIVAVFIIAMALAQINTAGEMGERLKTLHDPYTAGTDRFLIWKASWKMLLQGPWYGRGLGTYWFAWPPFRPAGETSGGYFVHNDYLQIAIEGGWPALFLMLAILVAVANTFKRAYLDVNIDSRIKIEAAGLFAALISVFLHNFFDFNLYSVPATILAGLFMGRMHFLSREATLSISWQIPLSRWLRPQIYSIGVILLIALPMAYLITSGAAYYYYQKGSALIKIAQLKKADAALHIAELLWPSYDLPTYLRASIYQVTIQGNPHLDVAARKYLFLESEKRLQLARALNPWRPEIFIVYARLYQQNPDLAGQAWYEKAVYFYRHALAVDPSSYEARISYAGMLLEVGDAHQAAGILKEGIEHWYPDDYRILPYYHLTSTVCRQVGDTATANKVDNRITAIVSTFKKLSETPLERTF